MFFHKTQSLPLHSMEEAVPGSLSRSCLIGAEAIMTCDSWRMSFIQAHEQRERSIELLKSHKDPLIMRCKNTDVAQHYSLSTANLETTNNETNFSQAFSQL